MTFEINKKKYKELIGKYKDMKLHNIIYLFNKSIISIIILFTVYAVASPVAFCIKQMQGNIVTSKKDYNKILLIDFILFIIMAVGLIILIIIDKKRSPKLYHKTIIFYDDYFIMDKQIIYNKDLENIEINDDYFKFTSNGKIYTIVYEFYDNGNDLQKNLSKKPV